ncbi:MAG: tetratricopeptide repeat protein [Nostocaceae cyanobacterium]|nr:tetratricopeptide repeat protein [Nostocaceae cyanobacterium]
MIEQVAAAFERQDYRTAAELLKQLVKESPNNPWVQLYVGRMHEVSGKREKAEKVYRQLLKVTTNTKIMTQARQGIARLEALAETERKEALASATADPSSIEQGVLVLEPIESEDKTSAAQKFAKIMQIDAYTARLTIPSRGWRVYRSSAIGELKFYGQQLREAGIPCFWAKLSDIQTINVFQVLYFQKSTPQPIVVCRNDANQSGSLSFDWSEVKGRVIGNLPIFEEVVDLDIRRNLQRKTQTQDYFHFCDLHLPSRRSILRIYDNGYQFHEGVEIIPLAHQNTVRINWNSLQNFLKEKLPDVPVWSDFSHFGETVLDNTDILNHIQPHISIVRQEPTNWDAAFHLYSGLVFVREEMNN